jgi:hypothetical protein
MAPSSLIGLFESLPGCPVGSSQDRQTSTGARLVSRIVVAAPSPAAPHNGSTVRCFMMTIHVPHSSPLKGNKDAKVHCVLYGYADILCSTNGQASVRVLPAYQYINVREPRTTAVSVVTGLSFPRPYVTHATRKKRVARADLSCIQSCSKRASTTEDQLLRYKAAINILRVLGTSFPFV